MNNPYSILFDSILNSAIDLKDVYLSSLTNISKDQAMDGTTCFFKLPGLSKVDTLKLCADVLRNKYNNIVVVDRIVEEAKALQKEFLDFNVISSRQLLNSTVPWRTARKSYPGDVIYTADVIIFAEYLKYDDRQKEEIIKVLTKDKLVDLYLNNQNFLILFLG